MQWRGCYSVLEVGTLSFWQVRDESNDPQGKKKEKKRKKHLKYPRMPSGTIGVEMYPTQLGQNK